MQVPVDPTGTCFVNAPGLLLVRDAGNCAALKKGSAGSQSLLQWATMRPGETYNMRCRMHGGTHGSGAPKGERNGNYRHGFYTARQSPSAAR
jgi:hypothetical protein